MIYTAWMKILYLIIIIIAALFSVLYLGEFSVFLLMTLLLLPVFMIISLVYIRCSINASVQSTGTSYHRNTPQAIQLVVKNNGFLPVSKAAAHLVCTNRMTNEQADITLSFPIPSRNVTTVEFTITVPHCGITDIELKRLQFADYIRLFSWKMHTGFTTSLMTLPSGTHIGYTINIPCSETDNESNIYSKLRAGDDPSEVYRIKEYQPGDMQKRIHWKLSSRTDTIWVKEYSFPIRQRTAVIMDYTSADNISADSIDTALEAAYTLTSAFIQQNISTVLYWYNQETDELEWNDLKSMPEINDCFASLLSHMPSQSSSELIKLTSKQIAIHSTNAVYFCTPAYNRDDINAMSKIFKKNRLFIITAEFPFSEQKDVGNIVFVRNESIAADLKKLSDIAEVMQE